ncbi:MAG: DUF3108 domain-containing protein [Salinivirgaceae bacterium]|jgi:hypothetical protein|nr:DUF3108 domain-containing protein [Salinivirgaceae bacterium]
MNKILTLLFLISSLSAFSQSITLSNPAFEPNEKLSYIAKYNMKGLMTELAGIDMEVTNITGKKRPVYRLKFTANTLSSWDDYVKVRHAYQTYIDPATIKPLIMAQDSDVKGVTTKGKYIFKHKSGVVKMAISKSNGSGVTRDLNIKKNTYDVVSMIYLSRSLNYANMKIGQKTPLSVAFLERLIDFNIKYLGKETINVKGMGNKQCYKIGIVLNQKFIVEPNATHIWLTADANKVPVLIQTIYKEGKAQVELSKFEGLKN